MGRIKSNQPGLICNHIAVTAPDAPTPVSAVLFIGPHIFIPSSILILIDELDLIGEGFHP